jgi:amiloride-sensitive sodium channel
LTGVTFSERKCRSSSTKLVDFLLIFFRTQFKKYHNTGPKSHKWTLQHGYDEDAGLTPYPFRAYLAGVKTGLTVHILTPHQELDYACGDSLQGYRVMLHTPMTIPRPSKSYFRIPLDQNVIGAIEPVMITTSETIKSYSPQRRKCYFSKERKLRYFRDYTPTNCKIECITNYTLELCECVNFFMPSENCDIFNEFPHHYIVLGENGTQICGTAKISCLKTAAGADF